MADASSAAAPAKPAPAATTPSTPSGKAPAPFDARLLLAKNLAPHRVAMPEAAAPGGAAGSGEGDGAQDGAEPPVDGAAAEGADGADGADGAADGEADGAADGDGGGEPSSPQETLDAVAKAFDSGDIDAMAAALKKAGAKVAGPTRRAFRAFQRRLQKADERDRKAEQRDREFGEARARAQQAIAEDTRRVASQERALVQKFGWAHQLERAWDDEDMTSFGKVLEKACKGASLATITQKMATGKQGKTPEERQLAEAQRKVQEEREALQREKAQTEDQKTLAQRREAAMVRVGEGLKSHPYLQTKDAKTGQVVVDSEALAEVFSAYEASWNGEKFTKTARACADELQEKLFARAKARGLAAPPPAAPAGGKRPPPGKKPAQQRTGVKEPPRTQTRAAGAPVDLEASRASRVAAARRMVEMQRRGVL